MFRSDVSNKSRRETTNGWKTFAGVISGLVLVISVLMLFSVVQSVDAVTPEQVDKSGLDILCDALGGTYYRGMVYSVCQFPDGTWMSCNLSTGDCTNVKFSTSPGKDTVNALVILKALLVIDAKVNNLTTPDLVPMPPPATVPPEGFCQRNDQGQLLLKIYNQGGADAAASTTRVIFAPGAPGQFAALISIPTPALAAYTGTDLPPIPIPNSCFNPNTLICNFTIGVDLDNVVLESNEINNNASGLCGPQFQ